MEVPRRGRPGVLADSFLGTVRGSVGTPHSCAQALASYMAGEADAFDAVADALGLYTAVGRTEEAGKPRIVIGK